VQEQAGHRADRRAGPRATRRSSEQLSLPCLSANKPRIAAPARCAPPSRRRARRQRQSGQTKRAGACQAAQRRRRPQRRASGMRAVGARGGTASCTREAASQNASVRHGTKEHKGPIQALPCDGVERERGDLREHVADPREFEWQHRAQQEHDDSANKELFEGLALSRQMTQTTYRVK
jgi:hypothetical protein